MKKNNLNRTDNLKEIDKCLDIDVNVYALGISNYFTSNPELKVNDCKILDTLLRLPLKLIILIIYNNESFIQGEIVEVLSKSLNALCRERGYDRPSSKLVRKVKEEYEND